jgi:Bacterial type II and III secretion system protein
VLLAIGPARTGAQQSLVGPENLPRTAAPSMNVTPPIEAAPPPALPPVSVAKERQIQIQARFVELNSGKVLKSLAQALPEGAVSSSPLRVGAILADDQLQKILRWLSQQNGVDLVTAPRVTSPSGQRVVADVRDFESPTEVICPSGQRVIIEDVREFRYPTEMAPANDGTGRAIPTAFETRNTGVTLGVTPVIEPGGRIEMMLVPSIVDFGGFLNYGAGKPARRTLAGDALAEMMKKDLSTKHIINQPIFETRKIATAASVESGQTVLMGGIIHTDSQTVTDESKAMRGGKLVVVKKTYEEKVERYLLIFLTARILAAEEPATAVRVMAATRPKYLDTDPPFSTRNDLPVAAPVPGKPGLVFSPYAPSSVFVDVHGFASGTQVKCPYSGKLFVTP